MPPAPTWSRSLPWLSAALPFAVIAVRGFPGGDDWQLELARVAAYLQALRSGQWPPYWADDFYAGHGSPVFLVYGQLLLALASGPGLAAHSGAGGFLLALALASALGVSFTQRLGAELAGGAPEDAARAGRLAACAYLTSPYLLADLLLRNAAAEYLALCCLPLALYGLLAAARGARGARLVLGLGVALVLTSHALVALMLLGLLLLLTAALVLAPEPAAGRGRVLLAAFGGGLIGLALAAFQVLPLVAYRGLLSPGELLRGKLDYAAQLGSLARVFDPREPYAAGILPLVCAILAALVLPRQPRRALHAALLVGLVVCSLLQTPFARACLALLPGLAYFQFPFRWNGPLTLCGVLLLGSLTVQLTAAWHPRSRQRLELGVCLLCALAGAPQLVRVSALSFQEVARFEQLLAPARMRRALFTATVFDEYLPAGAQRSAVRAPAATEPVLSAGQGTRIAVRDDAPRRLLLELRAPAQGELCLARWGLPFWQLRVDGALQPVVACADGHLGVIVPAGKHTLEARLPVPPARQLGLAISGLTGCVLVALRLRSKRARRSTRKGWSAAA